MMHKANEKLKKGAKTLKKATEEALKAKQKMQKQHVENEHKRHAKMKEGKAKVKKYKMKLVEMKAKNIKKQQALKAAKAKRKLKLENHMKGKIAAAKARAKK